MKLFIAWKPWKSSTMEAIPAPKKVSAKDKASIMANAAGNDALLSNRKPKPAAMAKTMMAWMKEMVAPPRALPSRILRRETGATRSSDKKPKRRSKIIITPQKTDENKIVWITMPGTRN